MDFSQELGPFQTMLVGAERQAINISKPCASEISRGSIKNKI